MARDKRDDDDDDKTDLALLHAWLAWTHQVVLVTVTKEGVRAALGHPELGLKDDDPAAEAVGDDIESAMGELQDRLSAGIDEMIAAAGGDEDEEGEDEEEDDKGGERRRR